jgi:hypothetical protein
VFEPIDSLTAARLSIPDADVMDDGVEAAARVGLFSDFAHSVDRGDVADQNIGFLQRSTGVICSGGAASVQRHSVTALGQQLPRHETKSVC